MKNVCFTWYQMELKPENMLRDFLYLIYQEEKCPKTGRLHYQGYVVFKNHKRPSVIKKMNQQAHFEERMGSHSEAKNYSGKSDSYVAGPWTFGDDTGVPETAGSRSDLLAVKKQIDNGKRVRDLMREDSHFGTISRAYKYFKQYEDDIKEEKNLKEFIDDCPKELTKQWQKDLLEHFKTQDRRTITWVVDEEGGKGKTEFTNYLQANGEASLFTSVGGASQHIAHAFDYQDYVIFDFTREKRDFVNYSIIENFKDGKLFKSKWESKMVNFKSRPVVVFANFEPEEGKLSMNRINLIKI